MAHVPLSPEEEIQTLLEKNEAEGLTHSEALKLWDALEALPPTKELCSSYDWWVFRAAAACEPIFRQHLG